MTLCCNLKEMSTDGELYVCGSILFYIAPNFVTEIFMYNNKNIVTANFGIEISDI